jgi:AcrR family transcriptional regulator
MDHDGKRDEIILKTQKLLMTFDDPNEATTRAIAENAGINQAMVNYYFGSKDELLKAAIHKMMGEGTEQILRTGTGNPRKVMFDFLSDMCDKMNMYRKYSRLYVPDVLLEDKITMPLPLVPVLKEYFGNRKEDKICRLMAYQIVSILQLIMYRPDGFAKYSGIDVRNRNELRDIISSQLDIILGEVL